MNKKLTRSNTNKMLCGVCGGIAEYFDVDPTLVRVAYAILSVFSFGLLGVVLYVVLAIIIPQKMY